MVARAGSRNWCGERLRITKLKIWQAFRRSRDRINTARGSKIPQPLRPEKRLVDARLDLPVGLRRRSGVSYIPGSVVQKALHAERVAEERPGGVASGSSSGSSPSISIASFARAPIDFSSAESGERPSGFCMVARGGGGGRVKVKAV